MSTLDRRQQVRRARILPKRSLDALVSAQPNLRMPRCANVVVPKTEDLYHSSEDLSQMRNDIDELTKKLDAIRHQLDQNGTLRSDSSRKPSPCTVSSTVYCSPPPLPPRTYRVTNLLSDAPPKPQRTFTQSLQNISTASQCLDSSRGKFSICLCYIVEKVDGVEEKLSSSAFEKWTKYSTIAPNGNLSDEISTNFSRNICWFKLEDTRDFLFVNPYNDLNDTKCRSYDAIQQLIKDVSENRNSSILFSGEANSGKSYLAEMLVTEMSARFPGISTALSSAMLVINAFTNVAVADKKYSSISTNEYRLTVRDGCLSRVSIDVFMTELSPICEGELKITEILAKGLVSQEEREKYFLDPLSTEHSSADMCRQMRDMQLAFSVLSISVADVFRVLSACVLLRRVVLVESANLIETEQIKEIESAAHLLGISPIQLYLSIKNPEGTGSLLEQANTQLQNLIKALYQRCAWSVFRRINIVLQHYCSVQANTSIVSDSESSTNDSGVELHARDMNITVIDCFGMRKTVPNLSGLMRNVAAESLICLNADSTTAQKSNDAECSDLNYLRGMIKQTKCETVSLKEKSDHSFSALLKNFERKQRELLASKPHLVLKHFGGRLPLSYNTKELDVSNAICASIISLFQAPQCTFAFARHFFSKDCPSMKNCKAGGVPVQTPFASLSNAALSNPSRENLIQEYYGGISGLLSRVKNGQIYRVHCFSSNDDQEYSSLAKDHLRAQINTYFGDHKSCTPDKYLKESRLRTLFVPDVPPPLPFDRNYCIKDGRKHSFPQRRIVTAKYYDPTTDYTFYPNNVIRVSGFAHESRSYIVDVGDHRKLTIPSQFTELSDPLTSPSVVLT
uniref:Myosin motor domain-containing protein n=1 Tax=Steinernema glaseri TaxID=37863 RepID=A0A1I8A712_9BILA